AVEPRQPSDDRRVVPVQTVAVQLDEVREQQPAEITRVRALRVAGDLRPLPGRQRRVDTMLLARELLFLAGDAFTRARGVRFGAKLGQLVFELDELLLELKRVRHVRRSRLRGRAAPGPSP